MDDKSYYAMLFGILIPSFIFIGIVIYIWIKRLLFGNQGGYSQGIFTFIHILFFMIIFHYLIKICFD